MLQHRDNKTAAGDSQLDDESALGYGAELFWGIRLPACLIWRACPAGGKTNSTRVAEGVVPLAEVVEGAVDAAVPAGVTHLPSGTRHPFVAARMGKPAATAGAGAGAVGPESPFAVSSVVAGAATRATAAVESQEART